MAIFNNLIQIIQIIAAIAVIFLVLMQHGKGADMGAAFGSGASGSVFGASGSASFLSRATAIAATVFFTATLLLAFVIHSVGSSNKNIIQRASETVSVPADTPVAAPVIPKAVEPVAAPATDQSPVNAAVKSVKDIPAAPAVPATPVVVPVKP